MLMIYINKINFEKSTENACDSEEMLQLVLGLMNIYTRI